MYNPLDTPGVPLELGIAFVKNTEALDRFSSLPEIERHSIMERSHSIKSKGEMQSFIRSWLTGR